MVLVLLTMQVDGEPTHSNDSEHRHVVDDLLLLHRRRQHHQPLRLEQTVEPLSVQRLPQDHQ